MKVRPTVRLAAAALVASLLSGTALAETVLKVVPLADLKNLPIQVAITSVIVAGETIGLEVIGAPSSFSML